MLKVIIFKGLPASGKTTEAKKLIDKNPGMYKRVNKDELRSLLDNSNWSKKNESFILKIRNMIILEALKDGKHVIIDDTNLHPKHEKDIRELCKDLAEVVMEDFTHVDVATCIERDKKRTASVGSKVIWKMYNDFIRKEVTPVKHVEGLPHAIICDMDGTLALLNGRNPYDASTCENDLLNIYVYNLINNLKDTKLIIVSGRESKYDLQTCNWLKKHNIHYHVVYMRKTGDSRRDCIIKEEIYNTYIKDKYNIDLVLDDRLQVCRMWYSLGLPLLRVGDPEADF